MFEIDPLKLGSNNKICITKDDINYAFIPIPKNGSTWAFKYFNHYNWKYFQCVDIKEIYHRQKIIILRDPFERYFSGLAQEFYIQKLKYNFNSTKDTDEIFSRIDYGFHTMSQSLFVNNLEKNQCIFLKLDSNFNNILFNFTKTKLDLEPYYELNSDSGSSVMDYSIKEKIKTTVYKNKNYYEALEKFLEKDLNLFNSVDFYKG